MRMKSYLSWLGMVVFVLLSNASAQEPYHVRPGDDIQEVLESAATDSERKRIIVHAGTYRPGQRGQAMIWFNARHDGITLEAEGEEAEQQHAQRRASVLRLTSRNWSRSPFGVISFTRRRLSWLEFTRLSTTVTA